MAWAAAADAADLYTFKGSDGTLITLTNATSRHCTTEERVALVGKGRGCWRTDRETLSYVVRSDRGLYIFEPGRMTAAPEASLLRQAE